MSGSGISWAMCKSAPRSRQITMPAPHHSVFYRPDALPAAQPTVSEHWRHFLRYLIMWIFTNIFCILHMPFGCVYKQANEHFGTSKCLARCQSLLSSLCLPPAFTTLRLNMRISTAMELCAQVSKLLSEVLSVEFVVFMIKCVFQLSIGHLACEMPDEIISRVSLFGDLAYHSITFKRKMCACVN